MKACSKAVSDNGPGVSTTIDGSSTPLGAAACSVARSVRMNGASRIASTLRKIVGKTFEMTFRFWMA